MTSRRYANTGSPWCGTRGYYSVAVGVLIVFGIVRAHVSVVLVPSSLTIRVIMTLS
jgi:hypothetical protein